MKNIFNNSFLVFIGKLAMICNVFTIFSILMMLFKWFKFSQLIDGYIIELGFVMGPVANISFLLWLLGMKWTKQQAFSPKWQTILIVFMLLVQFIALNR
jgi:hypothetical protein